LEEIGWWGGTTLHRLFNYLLAKARKANSKAGFRRKNFLKAFPSAKTRSKQVCQKGNEEGRKNSVPK